MDYTDEQPERWWVMNPELHLKDGLLNCIKCETAMPKGVAIPRIQEGALCERCAPKYIGDRTPMTTTYLTWLEQGDPRWWSPYLCNCKGCTLEGLSV